jgi:hypothetical protein
MTFIADSFASDGIGPIDRFNPGLPMRRTGRAGFDTTPTPFSRILERQRFWRFYPPDDLEAGPDFVYRGHLDVDKSNRERDLRGMASSVTSLV